MSVEKKTDKNFLAHQSRAWARFVDENSPASIAVSAEMITRAKSGEVEIYLTTTKTSHAVPKHWFKPLRNQKVLCLACGGGQQGPLLAAAGAQVTVFDLCQKQLDKDREIALTQKLAIDTVLGNMQDLSMFPAESFDLIFQPPSNCYIPDVNPVWKEAFRVLKPGGRLIAGSVQPFVFIFDEKAHDIHGEFRVKYTLPYSDLKQLNPREKDALEQEKEPFVFGHTLTDLLAGQTRVGFHLIDFFEDRDESILPISRYAPCFLGTLAIKPQ